MIKYRVTIALIKLSVLVAFLLFSFKPALGSEPCTGCWYSQTLGLQTIMPPGLYYFSQVQSGECERRYGANWGAANAQELYNLYRDGFQDIEINPIYGQRAKAFAGFLHYFPDASFCSVIYVAQGKADIIPCHTGAPMICLDRHR